MISLDALTAALAARTPGEWSAADDERGNGSVWVRDGQRALCVADNAEVWDARAIVAAVNAAETLVRIARAARDLHAALADDEADSDRWYSAADALEAALAEVEP